MNACHFHTHSFESQLFSLVKEHPISSFTKNIFVAIGTPPPLQMSFSEKRLKEVLKKWVEEDRTEKTHREKIQQTLLHCLREKVPDLELDLKNISSFPDCFVFFPMLKP